MAEAAERRTEVVLGPALEMAPTMAWAAGPEEGEVDFDPEAFFVYSREMLRRIAALGFGRIYLLQHHQGSDGLEVLCLKRAAGEVVRDTVHGWGAGWGRTDDHPRPNIFSWIRVAYVDSFSEYPGPEAGRIPVGHAGRGETQLIMASWPETVRLAALESLTHVPRWLEDATDADTESGRRWLEFCVAGWVRELARGVEPA